MIFSLDVRRARKGDCLLLHYGTPKQPRVAVIDGGPKDVYGPQLRPRLMEIRKHRKLPDDEPLPIDLVMVSHIDDDHIQGILELTREAITRDTKRQPPVVRLAELWHNSFEAIAGEVSEQTSSAAASVCASLDGAPGSADPDSLDLGERDPERARAALMVLASVPQGHRLRVDAQRLRVPVNDALRGDAISAGAALPDLGGQIGMKVAGPMDDDLAALRKKYQEWLAAQREGRSSREAALAAYVDESVPNLSSLVFLASCKGKRMLLTGDARGDKIIAGLESIGAMKPGKPLEVDILKVPHHGSSNNLETGFFKRIVATDYVFSGNGEHGNPERETMDMLFAARGKAPFTIHLTYPLAEIDRNRKDEWQRQQKREKARAKKSAKAKPPRENWSDAKHSLTAFFAKGRLAHGQTLKIVEDGAPHIIDLMDPLGF